VSIPTLESAPPRPRVSTPLTVAALLFRRMAEEGIAYCHWKSNEHLLPAMLGETDLDVLVDRSDAARLAPLLAELGYKRFAPAPERSYVGIEDYLALDQATGKLVHLHLHYRLVLGEKFLKGYRLPWERELLASRQLDPETGVYVSAPELELLLLVTRAALKLRRRELMRSGSGPGGDRDFLREFAWLAERVAPEQVGRLADRLLGSPTRPVVMEILGKGPSRRRLGRLRRAMDPVVRVYRTHDGAKATWLRWSREWRARAARVWRRFFGLRRPIRFSVPRGGVIVALLGADGSGKSTVARAITSWLSWRLEVVPLYFGFGDGPVGPFRRPLRAFRSLYALRRRGPRLQQVGAATPLAKGGGRSSPGSIPKALFRMLWAWSVVSERRDRLRMAQQARNLGWIVIGDRYPQAQIMGLGDGPLLSAWASHPWRLFRTAAQRELEAYRAMEAVAPDLVVKLHVSPEVSAGRKQDMPPESLARRADTVRAIGFETSTRVVEVDADQPLEEVLLRVRRAVWEML
jgi:thymidylate kinase